MRESRKSAGRLALEGSPDEPSTGESETATGTGIALSGTESARTDI